MDLTMDTYDFGTTVHIGPPPAADTLDVTDRAAKALREQAGG
jgi:hypothetical protein